MCEQLLKANNIPERATTHLHAVPAGIPYLVYRAKKRHDNIYFDPIYSKRRGYNDRIDRMKSSREDAMARYRLLYV
jgi:hypothetical protein